MSQKINDDAPPLEFHYKLCEDRVVQGGFSCYVPPPGFSLLLKTFAMGSYELTACTRRDNKIRNISIPSSIRYLVKAAMRYTIEVS